MNLTFSQRQLKIAYLLKGASISNPITSMTISDYANCSVRTVKNEISYLQYYLKNNEIANIISIPSKGYYLEAIDNENYYNFSSSVESNEVFFRNFTPGTLDWHTYLIQTLLLEKSITLDEIAYRTNYSKSYFQKAIKDIRQFFKTYNIEVKSNSKDGLYLVGKEERIRDALVAANVTAYYGVELIDYYTIDDFKKLFYSSDDEYNLIRRAFLKIVRESEVRLKDIDSKKLSLHILLMKNRIENNHYVLFDESYKNDLLNTYEYELSKKIFDDETIKAFVEPNEDEIINFARLLVVNRDLNLTLQNNFSPLINNCIVKANRRMDKIEEGLKDHTGSIFFNNELFELFKKDIISTLTTIELNIHFDCAGQEQLITYAEVSNNEVSLYALEMAKKIALAIYNYDNGPRINKIMTCSIAIVFDYFFLKVRYQYNKLNLAVVSNLGLTSSKRLADDLLNDYSHYINKIEPYNQYEMRKLNFDEYDAFICDGDFNINNYPLPWVLYRPYSLNIRQKDIFDNLFKYGYDHTRIDKMISFTNTYDGITIKSAEDAMKLCAQTVVNAHFEEQYDVWVNKEYLNSQFYIQSNSAFLFCNNQFTKEEFVKVYKLGKQSLWNGNKLKYLFVISLDSELSLPDLKMSSTILNYFRQNIHLIESLFESIPKTYFKIFNDIIVEDFLRRR